MRTAPTSLLVQVSGAAVGVRVGVRVAVRVGVSVGVEVAGTGVGVKVAGTGVGLAPAGVGVRVGVAVGGGAEDVTLTLSKVAVQSRDEAWLVTARPIRTLGAIGIVTVSTTDHVAPSLD